MRVRLGMPNTAFGYQGLFSNTTGNFNTTSNSFAEKELI